MSNFPKHDKAHQYAVHCLGVHEVPAQSNRGPIQVSNPSGGVSLFESHDFVGGDGYPWCASFWLTCWAVAGHAIPYLSPSAYALGNWARKVGWSKPIGQLQPGDGCVWSEGSGHISMFESFDSKTGIVHTIDGNWGDKVVRATHRVGALHTGIHVPETGKMPPAPKVPFWTISTSVNGHRKVLFAKYASQKRIRGILPRLLTRYGKSGITIKRSKRKPVGK